MANYVLATTNMSARINQKPFFRPPVDPVRLSSAAQLVAQCSCAARAHRRQLSGSSTCCVCDMVISQPTPTEMELQLKLDRIGGARPAAPDEHTRWVGSLSMGDGAWGMGQLTCVYPLMRLQMRTLRVDLGATCNECVCVGLVNEKKEVVVD